MASLVMIGQTLDHYLIESKLGEGGMGVVYKARDTHLDRLVAIKVLPPDKVADPERKQRFVQEAKAASALKHPNIVTIYDIRSDAGADFIVMEYIEGKTLAELITPKGLHTTHALRYAVQIADALAMAHGAGIVHRDLKPSNIMVTGEDRIKVLDFGLAKLIEQESASDDATRTALPPTEAGTLMGTAPYMSPEQVEGRKIDGRSDIFSFGSVLYEALTGRRAFRGDSRMTTLAAVIQNDPEPLGDAVPREVERLVQRCLRKDPSRRLQTMSDIKLTLDDLIEDSGSDRTGRVTPIPRRTRLPWLVGAAAVLALAVAAGWMLLNRREATPQTPLTAAPLTAYPGFENDPEFSPDGNQVAFSGNVEAQDNYDIYVKLIGPGTPLRLTKSPQPDTRPKWSPDGRWIAFMRGADPGRSFGNNPGRSSIVVVPALGGPEHVIAEPTQYLALGAWTPDGKSLVVPDERGLALLNVETRETRPITAHPEKFSFYSRPSFSPDGRFIAFQRGAGTTSDLCVLPLTADWTQGGEPRVLVPTAGALNSNPVWAPDGRDLLFISNRDGGSGVWRVPASGAAPPQRLPVGAGAGSLAVSHKARRLAYSLSSAEYNIWQAELNGVATSAGAPAPAFASTRSEDTPQFSPDGRRVAFQSDRSGHNEIWVCDADGSACSQLTSFQGPQAGSPSWSPDGSKIAFDGRASGNSDIYVVDAGGGKPRKLTDNPASEVVPEWSRDGRWIYFSSRRTGPSEIWKMPPEGGAEVQVTRNGGVIARESPDGRFLYFSGNVGAGPTYLRRMPLGGGAEEDLVPQILGRNFAVREHGIYFMGPRDGGGHTIQYLSFAAKTRTTIATSDRRGYAGFTVSPDGKRILWVQTDQEGSDLMLVENFR